MVEVKTVDWSETEQKCLPWVTACEYWRQSCLMWNN